MLGIDAFDVTVAVDVANGLPQWIIVGLPANAVKESRERVSAVLTNAGFTVLPRRITVNLAPADVKKEGTAFVVDRAQAGVEPEAATSVLILPASNVAEASLVRDVRLGAPTSGPSRGSAHLTSGRRAVYSRRGIIPQRAAMSHIIGYLTVDHKGRTTLPLKMRKQLGITAGVQLRIEQADNGAFEIVPAVSIPQDQLFYHSPEGRARLERAEEDFRLGRVTRTDGPEEAQAFLDSLKTSGSSNKPLTR